LSSQKDLNRQKSSVDNVEESLEWLKNGQVAVDKLVDYVYILWI